MASVSTRTSYSDDSSLSSELGRRRVTFCRAEPVEVPIIESSADEKVRHPELYDEDWEDVWFDDDDLIEQEAYANAARNIIGTRFGRESSSDSCFGALTKFFR